MHDDTYSAYPQKNPAAQEKILPKDAEMLRFVANKRYYCRFASSHQRSISVKSVWSKVLPFILSCSSI
jgi:hypothetical protein